MSRQTHNDPALRDHRRALRRNATPAERRLWKHLRRRQIDGWRFRRQYSVGPFVLDFYCPEACLGIELDGSVHDDPARAAYDGEREGRLREEGVRVIRFENRLVMEQVDVVVAAIQHALAAPPETTTTPFTPGPPPGLPPVGGGD